jgi:polysaccharide pyruvyl transferase WcaK-like protein
VKILVCGFYNKGNTGDDLFELAFKTLFPKYDFIFTDLITKQNLENIKYVIFGGGSFLEFKPFVNNDAYTSLYTKTILYISVGAETTIHPQHYKLLGLAELISIRSDDLDKIIPTNKNVFICCDIVYSLARIANSIEDSNQIPKSVLILPNISVVPNHKDKHWMHSSWSHFKTEFAQFLDHIIDDGYKIAFAAMSNNLKVNDLYSAIEIINHMNSKNIHIMKHSDIFNLTENFETIITQRYHGVVIAEMLCKKYLTIHHHDKLKSAFANYGNFVSYYNVSKNQLIDNFYKLKSCNTAINSNLFDELKEKVYQIIGE